MKTNDQLQKDVQAAINWEPLLNAAEIGVTAADGVITLTGTVDRFAKKLQAEDAAKNVAGVKVVVEKIEVQVGSLSKKSDNDIATEVLNALKWNWEIPSEKVKVNVEDGRIILSGEVRWNFQKEATQKAVNNLDGVKGVTNHITLQSANQDKVEKRDIEQALVRNWAIENEYIQVSVSGNKVTLDGTVDSLYQKDEAGRIAWNAPGVLTVDNELRIDYHYSR